MPNEQLLFLPKGNPILTTGLLAKTNTICYIPQN